MDKAIFNWAGNIDYAARSLHFPRSLAELQDIVRGARKIRAIGSRHSFNRISDTDAALVSLTHMNRVIGIRQGRPHRHYCGRHHLWRTLASPACRRLRAPQSRLAAAHLRRRRLRHRHARLRRQQPQPRLHGPQPHLRHRQRRRP